MTVIRTNLQQRKEILKVPILKLKRRKNNLISVILNTKMTACRIDLMLMEVYATISLHNPTYFMKTTIFEQILYILKFIQSERKNFNSKCLMVDSLYEEILEKLQQSNGFFNIFNCRSSEITRYQHRLNDYIEENISVIDNLKDKLVVLWQEISQSQQFNHNKGNWQGWNSIESNWLIMRNLWDKLIAHMEDIMQTNVNSLSIQDINSK